MSLVGLGTQVCWCASLCSGLQAPRAVSKLFRSKPSPPRPLLSAPHPRRVQDHQAHSGAHLSALEGWQPRGAGLCGSPSFQNKADQLTAAYRAC